MKVRKEVIEIVRGISKDVESHNAIIELKSGVDKEQWNSIINSIVRTHLTDIDIMLKLYELKCGSDEFESAMNYINYMESEDYEKLIGMEVI
jgi:hypothetical protein